MNDMQVFENPMLRCELRTLEKDGEIWFVAADVCNAFGETNRNRAMQALDDDEKGYTQIATPGGEQKMAIVNEPGLYTLLFAMQPQKARGVSDDYIEKRLNTLRAFKRWVTHEVLPTIRRTGRYSTGPERGEMTLSEAVRSLRDCAPEVRPCIHKLLTDMGFDLPAMEPMKLGPSHCMPVDKARFAEWFRQSYEGRGMTYQEVADALSTNRVNVYRWGHGVSRPRAPYMRTITEYFGPCPEE